MDVSFKNMKNGTFIIESPSLVWEPLKVGFWKDFPITGLRIGFSFSDRLLKHVFVVVLVLWSKRTCSTCIEWSLSLTSERAEHVVSVGPERVRSWVNTSGTVSGAR